jgi:Phosphotransferase enzyme family
MAVTARSAGSSGGPYRDRLDVLATGGLIEERLDAWAAGRSDDRTGPWRRVYGKLRPRRSPWAVLVYEAPGAPTVQVRLLETSDPRAVTEPSGSDAILDPLEILPCTADPALPGLPVVLAALDAPRVVRYHPGNRCTLHGGEGAGARYVKVLSEAVDDQPEVEARWAAARSGVLSFAVAEPHGWDERSRSSWYGVVPGEPVEARLWGPSGVGLARRVGVALGELAAAPLRPERTDDAASQLARTERGLTRAAAAAPALGGFLHRAAESLSRAHARLARRPLVPVHGAAHLGQWLVDDADRLGLVDFDRFARGEPEFDVATFVIDLRAAAAGHPTERLEEAVIDGYTATAGELDAERLALYLLHKQLGKAARTAASLRPDAEERARCLLEQLDTPLRRVANGSAGSA